MPYVTVFEITQKQFEWWWPAFCLIFVVIGIVLAKFVAKDPRQRDTARWTGWAMIVLGGFFTVVVFGGMFSEYRDCVHAYRTGQYSVVEGTVNDFHPMPYEGHQRECFKVQGKRFCYSDYEVQPGFNQSASHGGPIRAGLPVRISYYGERILRLEIRADSLPPEAERFAHAKAEERKWQQWMENHPMHLGAYLAFVLIALCWNVDWRHYIRYWRQPPHTRAWEIGFRLFFAACLAGSLIQLAREIVRKPRTVEDYMQAAPYGLLLIGFFLGADIYYRWRFRKQKGSSGGSPDWPREG